MIFFNCGINYAWNKTKRSWKNLFLFLEVYGTKEICWVFYNKFDSRSHVFKTALDELKYFHEVQC